MKRKTRRLLSLLMVLAMLCTMVPAAFAATTVDPDDYDWDYSELTDTQWFKYLIVCNSSGHTPSGSGKNVTCLVCGATGTRIGSGSSSGHDHTYRKINDTYHYVTCNTYANCSDEGGEEHDHSYYCTLCGWNYDDSDVITWDDDQCNSRYNTTSWDHDPVYWKTIDDTDYYYCRYADCSAVGTAPEGTHVIDTGLVLNPDSNLRTGDTYLETDTDKYVTVDPKVYDNEGDPVTGYSFSYEWTVNSQTSTTTTKRHSVDVTKAENIIKVKVTATKSGSTTLTGEYTWYAELGTEINVTATIYNTNSGYTLSDADDDGNTSIEEQIADAVSELSNRKTCTLDAVKFTTTEVTGGTLSAYTRYEYDYGTATRELGDVVFYPTSGHVGKVNFGFTAYYYMSGTSNRQEASGTLTFDVKEGGAGLGIVYSAISGENVKLDVEDFTDFWEETYYYGTLDYVTFGSISTAKGVLYDGYTGTTGTTGTKIKTSTKCYYSPTRTETGLDDLTFVPKSSSVTSVEIPFTASGTNNKNKTTTLSGTITILYTAKEVTPIQYESTGSAITLKADDFLSKYKEVMGVTKTATASNLSIQFLEAPTYGSLYLNYKASATVNKGTELTSKNILNYTFNGSERSTRSISDVTYVPAAYGSAAESLKFACYYNSTLKFVGTVSFGATDPITVEYTTMGANAVNFSSYDFTSASLSSGYVYFGTPATGTLYRNYANGTGTKVNNYDTFMTSATSYGTAYSLSTVTYVPAPGYTGVVEIPIYSAAALMTTQKIGVVKIYVGRSFTDVLGTTSSWAAPYINKLSAQGVVSGTDDAKTKFSPLQEVRYGDALKMIMLAAGYSEQAKTGTHWASGYLSRAYTDGLVSSMNIDLYATVTREEIAAIVAKALGLGYSYSIDTGVVKPSDSINGYVYSLYNAGIVDGTYVNGINYFYGSKTITRAEISKIVCKIMEYEK